MIINSFDTQGTFNLGKEMGAKAKAGDIFCLVGDLGVGKTIFSKGFAEGLGIEEDITSPTFSIVNIYDSKTKFYHFDVYRLRSAHEILDTGYEEYFYNNGICLIEWAEIIEEYIPENAVWVYINKDLGKGEDYREIIIKTVEK